MLLHLSSARAHVAATLGGDARHLGRVARDPGRCTVDDLGRLLRAHGVAADRRAAALERLLALGVSPPIAWAYAMAYDGTALADALVDAPAVTPRGAGPVRPDSDGARG